MESMILKSDFHVAQGERCRKANRAAPIGAMLPIKSDNYLIG
jgi:hypothetical protein